MLDPGSNTTNIESPAHNFYEEDGHFSADCTPIKSAEEVQKFNHALLKVRKAINFSESVSRENSSDSLNLVKKRKELYFPVERIKFNDLYDWESKEQQFISENIKKPRTGTLVTCNNNKLALFRMGDMVYAIDEKCPHMGGPLHLGDIENLGEANIICVVCPWHKWRIELGSGKLKIPPGRNKRNEIYPTKVLPDGSIQIGFSEISSFYFDYPEEF